MADLTAKRTLVKSPPELWTELSEVEGLARHLGEFGEIRITKVEPEKTVAWEGEHASGTVEIEASGWGTKVTLTAEVVEREPEDEASPPEEPEDQARDGQPEQAAEPEPVAQPTPVAEPAPVAEPPAPTWSAQPAPPSPPAAPAATQWQPPRPVERAAPEPRGFLSRLLGRRSRGQRPSSRGPAPAPRPQPPASWQQPAWHTRAEPPPAPVGQRPEPEPPPAAVEPPAQAPVATVPPPAPPAAAAPPPPETKPPPPEPALAPEQALAVLEGALDNLGSAHHRPFSRS